MIINISKIKAFKGKNRLLRELKIATMLTMSIFMFLSTLLISQDALASNENGRPKTMHVYHRLKDTKQQQGAHGDAAKVDWKKRQTWLEDKIQELRAIDRETERSLVNLNKIDTDDLYYLGYQVQGKGMITFEDGTWAYIVMNSVHQDEQVGDITIAIDHSGKYYINEGHICGGIINFVCSKRVDMKSASQFFQYFRTDTDKQVWQEINVESKIMQEINKLKF
jgi:hypothetical protein